MENIQKTHTAAQGKKRLDGAQSESKHSMLDLSTWREELDRSMETLEGAAESVSQFVQKKPWIAFGIAFGVGIIGSAILARKRAH